MVTLYSGHAPSNVNKDAKYSIVNRAGGGMEIRLIYRVSSRERALLTTARHEKLVAEVNHVKEQLKGVPGGVFYINEFGDVLVPHPSGGCAFVRNYGSYLVFDFEDQQIGPVPPAGLTPGQEWLGPHVGIPYVLTAGATDLKYQVVSGQRERDYLLSDFVGQEAAQLLARRLAKIKGGSGGRVYINEAREFFAWTEGSPEGAVYRYLGALEDDAWFPAPDVPGRE